MYTRLLLSFIVLMDYCTVLSQQNGMVQQILAVRLPVSRADSLHPGDAERFSLFRKQATVKDVFWRVPQHIFFTLSPDVWALTLKRDIILVNVNIVEFLRYMESQFPIVCTIINGRILVDVRHYRSAWVGGFVYDSNHRPLPGTSITVEGTDRVFLTDNDGRFSFRVNDPGALTFSHTGMRSATIKIDSDTAFNVLLADEPTELREVTISPYFFEGHHSIPEKMATGAYQNIDMVRVDKHPGTNIIERLDGQVPPLPGMADPVRGPMLPGFRGENTFYGNRYALIIVDGFPHTANTLHISPNDVDSITVMRDAASGALWGALAGNGVIVINTKKGHYQKEMQLSLSQRTGISGKPDNQYQEGPSATDFVNTEAFIYEKTKGRQPISDFSPVQALLAERDKGQIGPQLANQQLDYWRGQYARGDYARHLQQLGFYEQTVVSVSTGAPSYRFYGSLGVDLDRSNKKGNASRHTSSLLNFSVRRNNFEATLSARYSGLHFTQNAVSLPSTQPYLALTDSAGRPADIPYQYPIPLINSLSTNDFLDWHYYPLQEEQLADNYTNDKLFEYGASLQYRFLPHLEAAFYYQYAYSVYDRYNNHAGASYFARELANRYRQFQQGMYSWPVPEGRIGDHYQLAGETNNYRWQLHADYVWGKFLFNGLAGFERLGQSLSVSASRQYGMDWGMAQSDVHYTDLYQLSIPGAGSARIPNINKQYDSANNMMSYYFYSSLTFNNKYILSASLRKDQSSRFALQTNRQGMPLLSIGGAWEPIDALHVRMGYGGTGNTDYTSVPFTSIQAEPGGGSAPIFTIANPGDEQLSYEKQFMFNTGIDYRLKNRLAEGSVDYYRMHTNQVLQLQDANPTSGNSLIKDNSGRIRGWGVDLRFQTAVLPIAPRIKWSMALLYGLCQNKVVSSRAHNSPAWNYENPSTWLPRKGDPVDALYAFPMDGLDHNDGSPWGRLNGQKSQDYTSILSDTSMGAVVYAGTSVPRYFGSVSQTFHYKQFYFTVMLLGKGGYFMRKPSLNYYAMYYGQNGGTPDFYRRWQQPGDERHTRVPAMLLPLNADRDAFYQQSTANIIRADHIRIPYIQLGYQWNHTNAAPFAFFNRFKTLELNFTVNQVGVIWRANKEGIDPDVPAGGLPAARSYLVSIKVNF